MEGVAHARAGLIGNPSDGYFGKTISIIIKNFSTTVSIEPSEMIRIIEHPDDCPCYPSLKVMKERIQTHGYYGGVRILKAAVKRFADCCEKADICLPDRNFTLRYESDIPRLVGLSGSSALVTATFRALMKFFDVHIEKHILPHWTLTAENDELNIPGGLQDRVIQSYEGVVYMDFNKELIKNQGYGYYEPLDPSLLPPIYLAYMTQLGEGSEVFHKNLRERFNRGDQEVVAAMERFGQLTVEGKEAIQQGDAKRLSKIMDDNFDLRASLYSLGKMHLEMIDRARKVGASAKFAGSGGAVVGVYEDDQMLQDLKKTFSEMGANVIVPKIT